MKEKVLIIPDVHGRTFWKSAINKYPIEQYPNLHIVFLGDYLDPYESYDGITKEQALNNFKEILSLEIKKLFIDNISRFKVHTIIELNECKYLFTHAGITQKYLDNIASLARNEYENWNPGNMDPKDDPRYKWIFEMCDINETYNFDLFEECLQNYKETFFTAPLSIVSRERGGWHPYGSPIWADVHEHIYNDDLPGFYQIFGHTITFPTNPKDYTISYDGHNWAMLDASCAFILDNEGNIDVI